MRRIEENGQALWQCAMCGTRFKSTAAARACEDSHLDEKPLRRKPKVRVRGD